MLEWSSTIVGGPFNNFTGTWHFEGTFEPATRAAGAGGSPSDPPPPEHGGSLLPIPLPLGETGPVEIRLLATREKDTCDSEHSGEAMGSSPA